MSYFKTFLDRVLSNRNQHHINVMTAEQIDSMIEQISNMGGRIAALEMERERGDRKIHPSLKRMKEEAVYYHKI